ncbi:MAG: hypothetical protein KBD29_00425 [Candidatus Magasanikbacteria bacterium]|nr:hypothetical protein [Candidatus Magasanikbacteria bacterium]
MPETFSSHEHEREEKLKLSVELHEKNERDPYEDNVVDMAKVGRNNGVELNIRKDGGEIFFDCSMVDGSELLSKEETTVILKEIKKRALKFLAKKGESTYDERELDEQLLGPWQVKNDDGKNWRPIFFHDGKSFEDMSEKLSPREKEHLASAVQLKWEKSECFIGVMLQDGELLMKFDRQGNCLESSQTLELDEDEAYVILRAMMQKVHDAKENLGSRGLKIEELIQGSAWRVGRGKESKLMTYDDIRRFFESRANDEKRKYTKDY